MALPVIDQKTLKVAGVVAFYMFSALTMVFVNKAVLNNSPDLPLLFLFIQLLVAVILLHVSAAFSSQVEIPVVRRNTAIKLIPVVSVNIIGLVFNILCLRDVEASFFQIARGLVLPLTIITSSIHTRKIPSSKVLAAAMTVTLGFAIGVVPSKNLPSKSIPSLLSLCYGVLSSFFIALHAVLIKSSLPHCNNSTIQLAWWTNVGSAIMVFPLVVFRGEFLDVVNKLTNNSTWDFSVFLWGCFVTGIFGFLLCVAGLLSIKVTSPVTHMFSSAARTVLQTLLGIWIFRDVLNVARGTSIFVILIGTMYYTWIKSVEASSSSNPDPSPKDIEANGDNHKLFPFDKDSELEERKSSSSQQETNRI